jgi:hypothetical protein
MAKKNNNKGISLTRGWKGYVGGIGAILLGIYLVLNGNFESGASLVFLGLGILGIRHKLDYENE